MKFFEGEPYLTPMEASMMAGISYKTLQRWAEKGAIPGPAKGNPTKVQIQFIRTRTGRRYYLQKSIEKLVEMLGPVTRVYPG